MSGKHVSVCMQLFSEYTCSLSTMHSVFGLQLNLLLDALGVFASCISPVPLELKYPGPQGEVQCQ